MTVHEFDRYADVVAALADPALVPVLPESAAGPVGASVAWLRATVARFSSGETHRRRRALVEADLALLDPASLAVVPGDDVRMRVVQTLAEAMGMPEPTVVAEAVTVVAGAYFGGDDPAADEAVAHLVELLSDQADLEVVANRIGLLVQACDATAALMESASRNQLPLARVLLDDPPVRTMRRVAASATRVADHEIAEGDVVLLDLVTANLEHPEPLTFGAPPRVCPGRAHALALAERLTSG